MSQVITFNQIKVIGFNIYSKDDNFRIEIQYSIENDSTLDAIDKRAEYILNNSQKTSIKNYLESEFLPTIQSNENITSIVYK